TIDIGWLDPEHLSRAHTARLGLPGFGGVDPLDAAESAAAIRSATTLRSVSRTLGSVVRSAASAHSLAQRRYSAARELMERLVSMSMVHLTCGGVALPSPTANHSSASLSSISRCFFSSVSPAARM